MKSVLTFQIIFKYTLILLKLHMISIRLYNNMSPADIYDHMFHHQKHPYPRVYCFKN